jgi:hypothetical protein
VGRPRREVPHLILLLFPVEFDLPLQLVKLLPRCDFFDLALARELD